MLKNITHAEIINLKGIIVGNGATDFYTDVWPSYPETLLGMNMISKNIYSKYRDNNCEFYFRGVLPNSTSKPCVDTFNLMHDLTADYNWYDLLQPASSNPLKSVD